ncbi:NADP-dependent oxidoreductase domain-containing protein [Hygrophoropsis aurantiaca]|uniref:NADP-dependent oxidoreductase domain-containing protein n=1 Tax=Hygrophoropsis aurantiaca TaxID=72124 RepID=A0ACB7ZSL3_9AGAM|nr:NADP-dependent oxidoreductase domain-containing protein [Hygrophoropsis aurantiaca]
MASPLITLNNGEKIPAVGLGTYESNPSAVEAALRKGYRHLDCAWAYSNEKEVGEGLRASGVRRSEVYITSKVWSTYHRRVEESLDETLANLGTDYLDLFLIHWPVAMHPHEGAISMPSRKHGRLIDESRELKDTWKDMEAMVKKGKVRSIGVSNFSEMMLEKILPTAEIVPAVNQLELHLYNPQLKLVEYLKSKTIVPQAFSPLGSKNSPLHADETAGAIAQKYGLQTSDVLLGYLLAKDIVVVPKSVTPARIESNFTGALAALQKLTPEDIAVLDGVAAGGKQKRLIVAPWGIDLGFDNWPVQGLL